MVRKHHWRKLDTEDSGHCVEREGLSGPGSSWLWAHIPQGGGHPAPYSLTAPGEPSFPLLQGNSTPTCTPELQRYLGLHETTWTSSFSHVMKQGIKFSFSAQASLIRFYSEMTNCLGLWKYLIIFALNLRLKTSLPGVWCQLSHIFCNSGFSSFFLKDPFKWLFSYEHFTTREVHFHYSNMKQYR